MQAEKLLKYWGEQREGRIYLDQLEIVQEYTGKIPDLLGQPRISFLIGAGCSTCAGLPLMHELTTKICDLLDPQKSVDIDERIAYALLYEIKEKFEGLENISIEDYLSEIQDIDAILNRQSQKGVMNPKFPQKDGRYELKHSQLLLKRIKEQIRLLLGAQISTIKYHRQFCSAIHGNLVKGRKRAKHTVNYFILNYDTLFEDALALEEILFTDGFIGGATAWWDHVKFSNLDFTEESRFLEARVYKLHGSIDWIKPEHSEFPVRLRATLPLKEIIGEGEPVVIYPSSKKYKETQYDPYAQMMSIFRKCLTTTENHILAIIGYGFNDEHINIEIYNAIKNSFGALSVIIFYGGDPMPTPISTWISDTAIASQILILGRREIWKDSVMKYRSTSDINWYKFEEISNIVSGVSE